ncbi:MAG TPA: phosphoketolase, partial [Firmicutes bacterium]|nr:phosphoketolase [Bacillota bacterium]
ELGYSLAHSFGAVLDNPNLIVSCIVGDGEAETGPLATSWHLNKIINPKTDGVVLPILHLNGYKISNPTLLSRIPRSELKAFLKGCGWNPYFVEASSELVAHEKMATVMDQVIADIKTIKKNARKAKVVERPVYPMIVFISKKGWTGPKIVEEKEIEGTFRAHQVPIVINRETGENLDILESWLKSYGPEELFDVNGILKETFASILPDVDHKLFDRPYTNGGKLLHELELPDYRDYGLKVKHGNLEAQDMTVLATFLRDTIKMNAKNANFKIFAPDETMSNRMAPLFEVTNRQWNGVKLSNDEFLGESGGVIDSVLSEHICEGMLEGYILTGRHGIFDSYEAFIRVVDSMISQHAKWLKVTSELPWRESISSLNLLLTSHCWQQDHNGYTHQDPGLINHILTKKPSVARIYLPPDANTLLSTMDHCLRSKDYINVVVASKHPRPQWLSIKEAEEHCRRGVGVWNWASNDGGKEPDVVLACSGETPTLEALAAVTILREYVPKLKVRLINVVDLFRLTPNKVHPHGLTDAQYDKIFTKNKPIIFAFHGYPSVIHELTYNRTNQNLHVHGYVEEGTITTPFDMRVQNRLDRFNLVLDVLKYMTKYDKECLEAKKYCNKMLKKHESTIGETGVDINEVRNWKWTDFK